MLRGILLPFNNALTRDTDMVPYTLMGNEKATLKDVDKSSLHTKSKSLKCAMSRGILFPFHNVPARDIDMVSYTLMGNEKATLKDVGRVQLTHKI
jgi:hypothetical protein